MQSTWRINGLFHGMFSSLNTSHKDHKDEAVTELKKRLELLRTTWMTSELSFTPKMHTLPNHGPEMLQCLKGFSHMTEERVERFHQKKARKWKVCSHGCLKGNKKK